MNGETLIAAACIAGGTATLYAALRTLVPAGAAAGSLVCLLLGTSLGAAVLPATDVRAAAGFLGAAGAVAWSAPAGRHPGRFAGAGLLLVCALALTTGADLRGSPGLRLAEALFSSRDGLLFWNPAAWVAILSWPALFRRNRGWASALFAAAALAVLVTSAAPAGAGGPWAVRRFAPVLPLFAPALAVGLHAAARAVARRPALALAAAGCVLVVWNLLFMELYRGGRVPRDGTVSFPAVAEENAATLARLVGAPPAWPANWVFAWRHGWPVERFDLVVGKTLASSPAGERDIDIGDLGTDAALLLEGWSVRHPCGAAVCRAVEGRARLVAPLEEGDGGRFTLDVHAAGEGLLSVAVNGEALGSLPLAAEIAPLRFPSRRAWGTLNEVTLTLGPGGRVLVDRLRLAPSRSVS